MINGRITTYLAFGAAVVGVALLGFASGREPSATADASDLAMPDMTDVADNSASGSPDQAQLRAEIRSYLLEEPEVILEAFQILEERRVVEEAQADIDLVKVNAEAIFEDGFSYVGGNPEGSITLVEFQDYRCGYCKRAHGEVQELIAEDGDIRLVIKEFPILGADSLLTSRLAIATLMTQGGEAYKRISDAFMSYAGPINDESIDRLAQGALVDIAQSRSALEDPEIMERIDKTRQLSAALKISGTPTFIIGEKVVRGYLPKDELAEVVALSRRVNQ